MLDIFVPIKTLVFLFVCMLVLSYGQDLLLKSDSNKWRIAIAAIGLGHIVLTLSFAAYAFVTVYHIVLPQLTSIFTFIQAYGVPTTLLFGTRMLFGFIFIAAMVYLLLRIIAGSVNPERVKGNNK